jgi:hypothetical protein
VHNLRLLQHFMNKRLMILVLVTSICGFAQSQNESKTIADSVKTIPQNINSKFYVKDSTQYSPLFLKYVSNWSQYALGTQLICISLVDEKVTTIYRPYGLNDSSIVDSLTYLLPTSLPINKIVHFAGQDSCSHLLLIKRINYTDILYEYKVNNVTKKTGHAILTPWPYLGMGFQGDTGPDGFGEFFDCYIDLTNYDKSWRDIERGQDYHYLVHHDDGDYAKISHYDWMIKTPILKRE